MLSELAVLLDQDGVPTNAATTLLGDRTRIESLIVEEGVIVMDLA